MHAFGAAVCERRYCAVMGEVFTGGEGWAGTFWYHRQGSGMDVLSEAFRVAPSR